MTDKRLWKEGNIFIVNLAAADICVTSFVDPFSITGVRFISTITLYICYTVYSNAVPQVH